MRHDPMEFTRELVLAVRQVAKRAGPNYTYPSTVCTYYWDPSLDNKGATPYEPACIVGHAITIMGYNYSDLGDAAFDTDVDVRSLVSSMLGKVTHASLGDLGDEFAARMAWLTEVQSLQDRKYSWHEAIRLADTNHPEGSLA